MTGSVEWVPAAVFDTEQEWTTWTWADGRVDQLPTLALPDDLPGEEVASLGTYTDGLGVGGTASRLYRMTDDLWLVSTGNLEERDALEACRCPEPAAVVGEWLTDAADELSHFADLPAFVAARLAGLLGDDDADDVDAAVVAELDRAMELVSHGGDDLELGQWTGVIMFLTLPTGLRLPDELPESFRRSAPWVQRLLDGEEVSQRVWRARLEAWTEL